MNRIQIPEGMGLEQFGLFGLSSLGRKSKGLLSKSPLRKLHKKLHKKISPVSMLKGKKRKGGRGGGGGEEAEAPEAAPAPEYQAPAPAPEYQAPAPYAPGAPSASRPYAPSYAPSYSEPSEASRPEAVPDVVPTQTGPQQSAPTGPPPMPGHPQEVTAEPEGEAAPSPDGESDESPEEGEAPEAESQGAEPEETAAEPEEGSEPAQEQEQEQQEEPSSAEGVGEFVIDPRASRRLMVKPPPPRPAWQSHNLDRVFSAMKQNAPKLSGLSQTAPAPAAQGGVGGLFVAVLGLGAVAGLIYYLKKVKKTS